MIQFFRDLLGDKYFWIALVVANFLASDYQPRILLLTLTLVSGMWVILGVFAFLKSSAFRRLLCKLPFWIGILLCWLVTAVAMLYVLQKLGYVPSTLESGNYMTIGILNTIPWCVVPLFLKWLRYRKRQNAERTWQLTSARTANEKAVAQKQRNSEQKRRDDARTNCELFYREHAPEIGNRFSESQFADYLRRQMHDGLAADYVEERAGQLLKLLETHRERIEPAKVSLGDLAEWYVTQKREIQNSPLDEEEKVIAVTQLEERFARMQDHAIRKMRPV